MSDPIRAFYDDLADWYHLIFQDWTQSIQWQASVLGPLIEGELPTGPLRILDCACGIGTQTLGLFERGHVLVGTDLSAAAIARARRVAQQRSLSIKFKVANMRDLSGAPESDFDVVLASDNALPHLLTEQDLGGVQQIASKLHAGGLPLASIRHYDQTIVDHPAMPPPTGDGPRPAHQGSDQSKDGQEGDWHASRLLVFIRFQVNLSQAGGIVANDRPEQGGT